MCAWREGGCAYGRGGVCVHEEREGVYMEGVECAWGQEGVECVCMERGRVCIWKEWSVCAWGESSQDYPYPITLEATTFARQHQLNEFVSLS